MTPNNQPHRPTGYEPGDYPDLTAAAVSYALEAKGISRDQVEIGMIWAQTTDGVIGDGADMPWYLPEDLKHFKNATSGYPVVMGRTSWEALDDGFRPLPDRTNYVITRQDNYDAPGGIVEPSIPSALANAAEQILNELTDSADKGEGADDRTPTVWVLGGGQVYAQCMPVADRIVITEIDMEAPERFQVYAPLVPEEEFEESAQDWQESEKGHPVDQEVDTEQPLRYRFCTWTRR
ncbi:dihydrofolate reductase [Corynebacterium jeikeium]|uniref:dihydrofolate reductase n=1 Tax=Corynebacterium jeikeium (strain K411) TaxID=306537 RepID=Q4JX60_CORJK|nr:dihydrofolate reductase [Corynebacterium jeikeium]CAI36597.1 folA [Corynebacterium jeikeium K411]SUY86050.1 dihydrofolate reductase [Corynebacterium jeikeium]